MSTKKRRMSNCNVKTAKKEMQFKHLVIYRKPTGIHNSYCRKLAYFYMSIVF